MFPFMPMGNLASFTGATSAPTSVQSLGPTQIAAQVYHLNNIDAAVDCVVGWGPNDAAAKLNAVAAAGVVNCYYLKANTDAYIVAGSDAYFSGITGSSTAIVKVQAGVVKT